MSERNSEKKSWFWDNPYGGLYDFNGDGREDLSEQWVAEQLIRSGHKRDVPYRGDDIYNYDLDWDIDEEEDTDWRETCEDGFEFGIYPADYDSKEAYEEALNEAKAAWRETCEDGSEFDVDPEDYDTEEAYKEALDEAKNAWKDAYEDGGEYGLDPDDFDTEEEYEEALAEAQQDRGIPIGSIRFSLVYTGHDAIEKIKPENYPNKRRYNAACVLANESIAHYSLEYEKQENACCQFIIDNADTIFAANYLSHKAGFLYAQAIKDHFQPPISLPDEDETREMEFSQIVRKIAKRDIPLSLRVWRWCLRKFMPYAQYDRRTVWDMTTAVLNELPSFPEGYRLELIRCMGKKQISQRLCLRQNVKLLMEYRS